MNSVCAPIEVDPQEARRRGVIQRLRRCHARRARFQPEHEEVNVDLYTTDLEIALLYLQWNEGIYTKLGALRDNYTVMEASIIQSGDNAVHFNGRLIDLPLWKKCIAQDAELFESPPAGLPAEFLTQQTLLECIPENGYLVEYVQNVDKAIALIAVTADPEALECLDPDLYENDADIAIAITKHGYYGYLLRAFSPAIRANFDVALAAVRSNGSSLAHVNPCFRRNKQICFEAVREDNTALPLCALDEPWAAALVCVVLARNGRYPIPQAARLTFECYGNLGSAVGPSVQQVSAYVHDLMCTARAFDMLTLDQKTDAGDGLKRPRRGVRLNDDCLRIVKKFLPSGKMYKDAMYTEFVLEKLKEDEPRHKADLQATQQKLREARNYPGLAYLL